jgi:hypothetical protein
MAKGKHPVPFRTRKLSPSAPMVLPGGLGGRVGRRRTFSRWGPLPFGNGPRRVLLPAACGARSITRPSNGRMAATCWRMDRWRRTRADRHAAGPRAARAADRTAPAGTVVTAKAAAGQGAVTGNPATRAGAVRASPAARAGAVRASPAARAGAGIGGTPAAGVAGATATSLVADGAPADAAPVVTKATRAAAAERRRRVLDLISAVGGAGLPGRRAARAGLPGQRVALAELRVAQVGPPGPPVALAGLPAGETERLPRRTGERTGRNGRDARRAAAHQPPGARLGPAHDDTRRQASHPGSGRDQASGAQARRAEAANGPATRAGAAGLTGQPAAAGRARTALSARARRVLGVPVQQVARRRAEAEKTSPARPEEGSSGLRGGRVIACGGRTAAPALAAAPTGARARPAVPTPGTTATGPSGPGPSGPGPSGPGPSGPGGRPPGATPAPVR